MRRGLVFATSLLEPLSVLARAAEECGFARVWTTEYPGRDAVARALAIVLETETIEVGTGVAYAFSRAPLAMAALAADVQRLARGRFALGISAGTRGVRRWYDVDFEPAAPRMRDYVAHLRRLWMLTDVYPRSPSIYLPVFHPVMTRHAAAVADGLLIHPLGAIRQHLMERIVPAIRRGSSERDAPLDLVAWQIASIDPDEEAARVRAAAQIAFYLSTPSYASAVEGTSWQEVPQRLRAAAADGRRDWSTLARLIPDDLVDELAVAGRPAEVARRMDAVGERLGPLGVTELVVQTVGAGLSDDEVVDNCHQIIRRLGTQGPRP